MNGAWTPYPIYRLLPDDFNQDPLSPAAVKLPIKDLLPGAKVQLPLGDRRYNFPPHHLPFQVGVAILFPRPVVPIAGNGFVRGQLLEPFIIVLMKPKFVIIDEYGCRDVHGIDEGETFPDAAFLQAFLHL
jgi:hypothetical protein